MRSQRRMRLLLLAICIAVFIVLYLTADARRVQDQKFYRQTAEALDAQAAKKQSADGDDDGFFEQLRPGKGEPRDGQKLQAPLEKGDDGAEDGYGREEKPVDGRKLTEAPNSKDSERQSKSQEDHVLEVELNSILKRSPIIIFSKSYCPYSKKAKSILVGKYSIVPAPFVVELDIHPLGPRLQEILAKNTGRTTVPNVLVNGLSIGGGDEVEAMDESGLLAEKIKTMAGKRIMEVKLKPQDTP